CLEKADGRVCSLRRLIGIEPEIIERAPANRIGVGIVRKSFRRPSQRIGSLSGSPRSAAKSSVVLCAVICPAGMLRWRVKPDVSDVNSSSQRHAEGLNCAIQVLVIEGILIVPDASSGIGHLIAHEPNT